MNYKIIFIAFFLEVVAIHYFFELKGIYAVLIYLGIHFVASIILAVVLTSVFMVVNHKTNYLKNKKHSFFPIFLFIFSSSVIGVLFSLIFIIYVFFKKYKFLNIKGIVNSFDDGNILPQAKAKLGAGALNNFENAHAVVKFNVLNYIKDNDVGSKGSILKMALSDNNDEIRLYGFSILSKNEDTLTNMIFKNLQKLKEENLSIEEKNKIYKTLGSAYWEFIYLQISDDNLRNYYMNLSKEYFLKAVEVMSNDYETIFNLGKIYLREGDLKKAEEFLMKAYKWNKGKVIPYLAEIYFMQKEYLKTKQTMKELSLYEINSGFYYNYLVWAKS
jgi:tetratricopeptide (TPR) repeat protein